MAQQDIVVRVVAEGTGAFVKNVKTAGDEVEKTGKRMQSQFSKIGKLVGGAFAVGTVIQFTKALVRLAVDLDATEAKFKTVFGSATRIVEDFAKKNATSLGLTVSEYKKAAAAAGDLLIPLGFQREEAAKLSAGLVNLSGALSAWSGGQFDAKQTAEILTKAILGEREQLKTLGINIQEADVKGRLLEKGQAKLTGTMLAQAKATATLELIYEKSADAQTAFADGTKTLAEQQLELTANFKTFGENIANLIIPALNDIVGGINDVIEKYKEFAASLVVADNAQSIIFKTTAELVTLEGEYTQEISDQQEIIESKNLLLGESAKLLALVRKTTAEENKVTVRAALASRRISDDAIESKIEELRWKEIGMTATKEEAKLLEILVVRQKALSSSTKKATEEVAKGLLESLAERKKALTDARIAATTPGEISKITAEIKAIDDQMKKLLGTFKLAKGEYEELSGTVLTETERMNEKLAKFAEILGFVGAEEIKLQTDGVQGIRDRIDAEDERKRESANLEKALRKQNIDFALDGLDIVTTSTQAAFSARQAALDNQLQRGLISEKQYQEERAKLLTKQAKADKANAIFSTVINAAAGIVAQFKAGPAGIALAAIVSALAAAQIAAIIATPIPKFAKGTKGGRKAPKGMKLVGEEGPELIVDDGGYDILTSHDSKEIMKILGGYGMPVQFNTDNTLVNSLDLPMKTLKDINKESKQSGIDLRPLLNASDRQRLTIGKKLDRIHEALVKQTGHRMTQA